MASRRNRIIYASQSVHAEGKILYRIQTMGSATTFTTTDLFQLGQLNLTDVADDAPEVAVTLDSLDYGSIYTMATLSKVPTHNLHHNVRQTDGVSFFGTVSGSDVSEGSVDPLVPALSGTGKANLVFKDRETGQVAAYAHGVQLIDFGRECGVSKGCDIWSPIQAECALGTAQNQIEMTKLLRDVFINKIDMNYQTGGESTENYAGETESKKWLLNSARFLSWEEWQVGNLSNQINAATLGAKSSLKLSLASPHVVPVLENKAIGFLKKDLAGRAAILLQFASGGGLAIGEHKAIPVFDNQACIPTDALEYFIYDSSANQLNYILNGLSSTLIDALPPQRSAFINGDKIFVLYAADAYAEEVGSLARPVGADSSFVSAEYFAPISTNDVEDIGGIRQGQIEAYLVDPELVFKTALTGAVISGASITFNSNLSSRVDLTKLVGLTARVIDGPGKNGPAREIIAATNSIVGSFNNGTINLGGADWAAIKLSESSALSSTTSGIFVNKLCGVDNAFAGSDVSVVVSGSPVTKVIDSVVVGSNLINITVPTSSPADNGSDVLVSSKPTTASTLLIGDYEMALRLKNVTISADLTREKLTELGHLNVYARTLTLPIKFTVTMDTTASDMETFAKFAGKLNEFKSGTLTDLDIVNILTKDNNAIVVMVYQQTDQEAGGSGLDRKVLQAAMFGDEYFINGVRHTYTATDGSQREYPLKTVIVQNLRPTNEAMNTPITGNATQTFGYRGTNEVSAVRGYVNIDLITKAIESQGE